jgi:hypothetical protein
MPWPVWGASVELENVAAAIIDEFCPLISDPPPWRPAFRLVFLDAFPT